MKEKSVIISEELFNDLIEQCFRCSTLLDALQKKANDLHKILREIKFNSHHEGLE